MNKKVIDISVVAASKRTAAGQENAMAWTVDDALNYLRKSLGDKKMIRFVLSYETEDGYGQLISGCQIVEALGLLEHAKKNL